MEQITLDFSPEELIELARQMYLASYFMITYDDYENEELAKEIYTKICATGFKQLPESGAFEHGGFTETLFRISIKESEKCEPLIESFEDDAVMEYLPYALADRDFVEKYGKLEVMEILNNNELRKELEGIQNYYKMEIMLNGAENLRLVKKDDKK